MIRVLAILAAMVLPASAEEIVAGLSQTRIGITADFTGEEILVYGAVKRESPPPSGPLDVIVTVAGPSQQVTVRRKEWRWGIWMNAASVAVDAAPSLYAVASTGPLDTILSETDDLRYRISVDRAIRAVGIASEAENAPDFVDALVRLQTVEGRYDAPGRGVRLTEDTLFRADMRLPPDLIEGDYRIRLFLLRGGRVIDQAEQTIPVRKVGLERAIFALSQSQPLVYGLLSVALAVLAGWGASAAFRALRL